MLAALRVDNPLKNRMEWLVQRHEDGFERPAQTADRNRQTHQNDFNIAMLFFTPNIAKLPAKLARDFVNMGRFEKMQIVRRLFLRRSPSNVQGLCDETIVQRRFFSREIKVSLKFGSFTIPEGS